MSAPSGALTRLLKVHLAVASFPLSDEVEARVLLERFSALGEQHIVGFYQRMVDLPPRDVVP